MVAPERSDLATRVRVHVAPAGVLVRPPCVFKVRIRDDDERRREVLDALGRADVQLPLRLVEIAQLGAVQVVVRRIVEVVVAPSIEGVVRLNAEEIVRVNVARPPPNIRFELPAVHVRAHGDFFLDRDGTHDIDSDLLPILLEVEGDLVLVGSLLSRDHSERQMRSGRDRHRTGAIVDASRADICDRDVATRHSIAVSGPIRPPLVVPSLVEETVRES